MSELKVPNQPERDWTVIEYTLENREPWNMAIEDFAAMLNAATFPPSDGDIDE